MEQSEGMGKEKMILDSSSNAEQSQAEKDDKGPVEQMDPKLRRMFSNRLYSQRSRQKKKKIVEDLEERVKILEDLLLRLQPEQAYYQNQLHNLMMEEQTMLHEMEYLKRKALLREAEDEKNRNKKSMLEEVKQDQLLHLNSDPLAGVSFDTSSYQVAGNGAQSSYIAPEARQMGVAAVADRHQTDLARATAQNPNPNP
ncbi:bZIP transcription factor 18-like [Phaseolus vulgaris]|uniref:bZIP transcription factor 18-like n=1 Tax=Phaseolus vulgaris TaxID=3885 RepID=UPI0035CC44E5